MSEAEHRNMFPLSLSQKNIWDLERTFEGTSINNISTTLRISGRVDFSVLQQTLHMVLSSDPTLRTRIALVEGEPMQYISRSVQERFPVYDFSGAGDDGLSVWENTLTRELISVLESPLYRFVLFRTGEHSGGVFVKIHHIISDGWSQVLICNRISKTYLALLSRSEPQLDDAPSYELHVQDEQDYLSSAHYEKDKEYWVRQLSSFGEPSAIKDLKGAAVSPVGRRVSFQLPQHLNHAIYSFCIQNRVAPFAVFYMALAIYFKRTGGADRFTIGVPIFNRTSYLFKQCTGMFVSTLPFVNEIQDDWSFSSFNEALAEAWYDLLRHQRFPLKDISAIADPAGGRLFQIALSYQDSRVYESHDTSVVFSGRWHYGGYQAEQLCIHLSNLTSPRQYAVDYDYLTQAFTEEEISSLHFSLMNLLSEALTNTEKPLCQLSMLGADEREKVIYTFNRTAKYIGEEDAYQIFSRVVREFPSRAALIHKGERLTYAALDAGAALVSAALPPVSPGQRGLAAVLLPRDFSLFTSIVGALRAGWAYLLLSKETPVMRILETLSQSGAAVLITDQASVSALSDKGLSTPVIDIARLPDGPKPDPVPSAPSDLAYVVYTSGSTGTPKGVEIAQESLMNLAQAMEPLYGSGAVLSLCSVGFDAFVLESAVALLNGQTIVLPSDTDLESPRRLAHLILNYAVGFLAITPSRLYSFLKDKSFCASMRIIERIVCGGEPFPRELLQALSLCTSARIYNQYGPSETTVAVSHMLLNHASFITAGAPLQNCRLYVLDEWQNPLPVGAYGELYIGGVCVGKGYRNDPDLTASRFLPSPFESGDRLYRTGDIACWTEDGEILLAGRRDRQIKLRGLRVEPQEISSCIASHPQVHDAAARVLELSGQSVIAVYYTSDLPLPEVELLTFAASYLPRYMLPSYIKRVDAIPLTANGKVDESRLPLPETDSGLRAEPTDGLVHDVLDIFRHVLRSPIGPDGDYFLAGGNSLTAMQTLAEVEERTGCLLRTTDLYACRTARLLAQCITQRMEGASPAEQAAAAYISKAPAQSRYPLSPVQRGIYFQSFLDETGLLYNMSGAFRLGVMPDLRRLASAFHSLIAGDEIFRTSFLQDGDGIFASVSDSAPFHLQTLRGETIDDVKKAFVAPFSLDQAPLLRAGVWNAPDGAAVLFLDTHHIISDGLTTPIAMGRLADYYNGSTPDLPPISYVDYAYHLSHSGETKERDRQYWKEHLTPMPPPLSLPTDVPRPHTLSLKGAGYSLSFSDGTSASISQFCSQRGISAYVLFLSGFGYLLSALSGQKEFTVGSPVSDRTHSALGNVCGPLLNVFPLKLHVSKALPVSAYLEAVRDEVASMMDHSACPPEEIISLLSLPRDLSRNPLYDVTLSMRPFDVTALSFAGAPVQYIPLESGTAKAELALDVALENGVYSLQFSYASDLFMEETVALYARSLIHIVGSFVSGSFDRLGEIDPLALKDRLSLIDIPEHTYKPYLNMPVHEMARQKALLHPSETAVVFHGVPTTRMQTEERACQIANVLTEAGVVPGERIGLAMGRTPDLFAAMLAVLKTGCAYVPLLSSLPGNRLSYMAETAGIKHILCDEATLPQLPPDLREMAVDPSTPASTSFQAVPVASSDLINVLFTSGSTGRPKGVMIRHSSISNLLSNMNEALADVTGPMICATTLIFDIFITESLLPLAMGKTVILADEEEMLLPWRLAALIESFQAGFIQFTASRLSMCLTNDAFCKAARHLQFTIVGGEQVSSALVSQFKTHCPAGRLVNLYGPTEAAVYITMTDLEDKAPVTIGKPMHNCRVYVMDESGSRVMPTATGELYLAGAGISAGYIARPDLTEASFLPDPFAPGEIMYKSGDLGRLRVDGRFDCFGRCDNQVKINGQRLETDEIVSTMLRSGLVTQAAVIPVSLSGSLLALHAFCTLNGTGGEDALASYLREELPDYMIPKHFHILDDMPYTPGGKIDLAALRSLAMSTPAPQPAHVPVETETNGSFAATAEETAAAPAPAEQTTLWTTSSMSAPSPAPNTENALEKDLHPSAFKGEAFPAPVDVPSPSQVPPLTQTAPAFPPAQAVFPPARQADSPPPSASILSTEDILRIWEDVLGRAGLRPDLSFFEQGGSSLQVLNILSRYYNMDIQMGLSEFYKTPTAAGQAALFAHLRAPAAPAAKPEEAPLPRFVPQPRQSAPQRSSVVLMTGATGFLGAHLLRSLLANGTERVICLVRGDGNRLSDALSWYFGAGWAAGAASRIQTVSGDITRPRMGIDPKVYPSIIAEIGAVYHAAADVRHYAADVDAFMHNNIAGTREAIQLALDAGVPLHHMSSLSVSGEYLINAPETPADFTEQDFHMGQNWQDNTYVKSKMLAESAVYSAMEQRGLRAKVYRLGRLIGRASDGVFQRDPSSNMSFLTMRAIYALGVLPEELAPLPVDLTPVDFAADAIVALRDAPLTALHIMNPSPPTTEAVFVQLIPNLEILDSAAFDARLGERLSHPGADKLFSLLLDFLKMYRTHSLSIAPVCRQTQSALEKAGFRFILPPVSDLVAGVSTNAFPKNAPEGDPK